MSMLKRQWGNWKYVPDKLALVFSKIENDGYIYCNVDLRRCNTSAEILGWIFQVKNEVWCGDGDIADLLTAIDDLIGVQDTLCSSEECEPFDCEKFLLKSMNNTIIQGWN